MPTQAEESAVSQISSLLGQLNINDRFRVLARLNTSANEAAVQNERDEFVVRRERVLAERRAAREEGRASAL